MSFFDELPHILSKVGKTVASKPAVQNLKGLAINIGVPVTESFEDRFGQVGKEFETLFRDAVDTASTKEGIISSRIRDTLKNVKPEHRMAIYKALDGDQSPIGSDLYARKAYIRGLLDRVWEEVDATGIPTERGTAFRQNYYPREYDFDVIQEYRKEGSSKRETILAQIMKDKGFSRNDAISILNSRLGNHARTKMYGPIDFKRMVDLPGYKMDDQVLYNYLNKTFKRTELAKRFGNSNELIEQMAAKLPPEQKPLFIELANQAIGPKIQLSALDQADNQMMGWARNELIRRYMAFSAMNNIWQGPFAAAVRTDMMSTLKAVANVFSGADDQFLNQVGAIQAELTDAFDEYSKSSKFFTNNAFRGSEQWSRSVQGLAGKYYSEGLYNQLVGGSQAAAAEFRKLGLDPDRLLKTGLKNVDKLKIANTLIHQTQFKPGAEMLPLFMQSPLGKTLFAMNAYNINWFNFVRKYVWREAVDNHNVAPLAKLLGMGYVIGGTNRFLWDTLLGKKADKDEYTNVIKNIGYSGSLGIMGDMLQGAATGKAVNSPVFDILNELMRVPMAAADGNFIPAANTAAKRVLYPAMIEHLPPSIALPSTVLARGLIERGLRDEPAKNPGRPRN